MRILYFTGTGNSLHAAKTIGNLMGGSVERLDKSFENLNERIVDKALTLVMPLYYAGAPKFVLDFLSKTDFEQVEELHIVMTRGETSSIADQQIKSIVGNKLKSFHYVSMPGNYIFQYESENDEKIKLKLEEAKKQMTNIANLIMNGPHTIDTQFGLFRVVGKPIYQIFKSKLKKTDQKFVVLESCNGCEICTKVCHVENIKMSHDKPTWQGGCQECMACIQLCPQHAIDYGKGLQDRKRYVHPEVSLKDLSK